MTCLVLCRKESCSTMRYTILAGVFCFLYVSNSSLDIDMRKMGLLVVSQNINVFVTSLKLDFNNINQITKESFPLYTENLSILIQYNYLSYIKDGSFDHNAKLEILNIAVNTIKQLPNSFGAAAKSLRKLSIYNALLEPAISKLNLTDLIKLKDFRAGWANWNGKFDPSLLPCNLKLIGIPGVFLTEFPDFGSCTPNISTIGRKIWEKNEGRFVGKPVIQYTRFVPFAAGRFRSFWSSPCVQPIAVLDSNVALGEDVTTDDWWYHTWNARGSTANPFDGNQPHYFGVPRRYVYWVHILFPITKIFHWKHLQDGVIFMIGIHILVRRHLYIETPHPTPSGVNISLASKHQAVKW